MKVLKGVIVGLAGLGLLLVPAQSQALFDGFNGIVCAPPGQPNPCINNNVWHWQEVSDPGVSDTEVGRGIKNGQLQLALRTFGSTASNSGNATGQNRLRLNNPPTGVTVMFVQVTVKLAVTEACGANTTQTRAVLSGAFFNDGSSTGPGDQTGDVIARIYMTQDSTNGERFQLSVFQCNDQDCNGTTSLGFITFLNKTWALNETHSLILVWQSSSSLNNPATFIGVVDFNTPGQKLESVSYGALVPSDSDPPGSDHKDLRVQNLPANCMAGAKQAGMDARFDNFFAQ